jgi:hypothetical protein
MAKTIIRCETDGLHIVDKNKEVIINNHFRVVSLGSGSVRVEYGENYSSVLVIDLANTVHANTKALLAAMNCGGGGGSGGGGGNTSTRFTQQVEGQTTTIIVVTANGGVLPSDDSKIVLVSGQTGVVMQGNGVGEYTVNRVATPNEIELNNAPPVATNYLLDFSIEQ